MFKDIFNKIKEAALSVAPIALIVIILSFTPLINFTRIEIITFIISTILLIIGMALFNLGSDLAMTPMGLSIGSTLTKKKKFKMLFIVGFLFAVLITIAEPDLNVLATQIKDVFNNVAFIIIIGLGVGLMLVIAIIRIIVKTKLAPIISFFYLVLFAFTGLVAISGQENLLPLAFDSGGVTTGPITVPFIMAFGLGIARTLGGKQSAENSFGLVALCSIGPVIAVMIVSLFFNGQIPYVLPNYALGSDIWASILTTFINVVIEVSIALGIIMVIFFVLNATILKLKKNRITPLLVGALYTYIGLILFLTAAHIGYMPIGYHLGQELASFDTNIIVLIGFVLGLLVVLAEPAIHILNKQVEEVTGGKISKSSMMIALSIGVGLAIALSFVRIIYDFSILYYLIPGYIISLGLSFFVPPLYTAIAFDSGGVASGPLTSTFILPLVIGFALLNQGESLILRLAFGVVAMVALTPLITIQMLGFKAVVGTYVREKRALKRVLSADDKQIIRFR